MPQEKKQENDLTAKIDKAKEESIRLLNLLGKGKHASDQPIYAPARAFLQAYYE